MVLLVIVALESIMDKEGVDVVIFVVKAADVDKIVDVVEAMDVKKIVDVLDMEGRLELLSKAREELLVKLIVQEVKGS